MKRLAAILLLPIAAHAQRAPDSLRWNREAAAQYLDARMDAWFAGAKRLKTGDGTSPCASCHTSVPYALARPALRRAMRDTVPTPQELRLAEEAAKRIATWDTHQPNYDNTPRKIVESRGTESVIDALILVSADLRLGRRMASDETLDAFRRMWETQRADGAWEWLEFGLEPFETAGGVYQGAALAALATGRARRLTSGPPSASESRTDRLRDYLHTEYPAQSLFNRTWALLASSELQDVLTHGERDSLVAELARAQRPDGGWSLASLGPWTWSKTAPPFAPPGAVDTLLLAKSDGYATGLVVHALKRNGLASHPAVRRGLAWLAASQANVPVGDREIAAWRTHSLNFDREHGGPKGEALRRLFMSDLATAFAVLALLD